ncbi:hypothetical protein ALC57_02634, partial [Trachymyrmex cornetzi]
NTGKTIKIASFLVACIFNESFNFMLRIMEAIGIKIGMNASIMTTRRDNKRIRNADERVLQATKEARSSRRLEIATKNELYEEEE